MAFYDWQTCPDDIMMQVNNFVEHIKSDMGDALTGIYLHGSLAMSCFNPLSSDIDLLIITEQPLTSQQQRDLTKTTLACSNQPIGFELSSLAREYLNEWAHPCRYDFHFSEDWRDHIVNHPDQMFWKLWEVPQGEDDDLAAHVMVTKKRGIVLYGKVIDAVLPDIPKADYQDSIITDFYWIFENRLEYKPYGILNMCRVLQFIREGAVSSKAEGGTWGLANLPEQYHLVVEAALATYRDNAPMLDDKKPMDAFAKYMREQIESTE